MPDTIVDSAGRAEDDEGLTPDVDAPHLTAPANAVPTRSGKGAVTLADCARAFWRQPSPPYLVGAVALALALRAAQSWWSWRDIVMVAGLVGVTPFVEWAIHVYLLHSPPFTVLGRRVEVITAREHRRHH